MNKYQNNKHVRALFGFVTGMSLLLTGCSLLHVEKEGTVVERPVISDTVLEDEQIDVSLPVLEEETVEEKEKIEEPIVQEPVHEDLEVPEDLVVEEEKKVEEEPVFVEVHPNAYELLEEEGYSLDMFPDFSYNLSDHHAYYGVGDNWGLTTSGVNFRKGPGTEYDVIDLLNPGTRLDLIARGDHGWYLVQYQGSLGFVHGEFIREVSEEELEVQVNSMPDTTSVVQAITTVNVRPESNTDLPEIGTVYAGETLEVIRKLDNGWYEVIYNGQTGYVCGDYVRETVSLSGDFYKIVAMNQDTSLYDTPYGSEIGSIPYCEAAMVYGEVDDYYLVSCNGLVGYVPKACCSSLSGCYVIVDISDQMLSLYSGTDLIMTTPVVTGLADSTPSDIGLFDIDAHEPNQPLTGDGYNVWVSYWMPYNGGEGLHDATWRTTFGGDYYLYSGSHGCVNMPLDAAATVYDYVDVGDQVLVKK